MWLILKTIFFFIITLLIWGTAWSFVMYYTSTHLFQSYPLLSHLLQIMMLLVILLIPIIISTRYFRKGRKKLLEEKLKAQVKTLSEKYTILETYKALAFLLMFVATGSFIYALVQFIDAPEATRKMLEDTMITSTVSYVITMFSLFCLTKMIDFLFDLDKKKQNKEVKTID